MLNDKAIKALRIYASDHDLHFACRKEYRGMKALIKKLNITIVPWDAPFDYDGATFFFRDLSDEMIIHEIAHHMVAVKKNYRRIHIPEFGLGMSPTTKKFLVAEKLRTMSVAKAREEELEASILAAYVAKMLGLSLEDHLRYTRISLTKKNELAARSRLVKWGLLTKSFVPAEYLLTIR